MDRIGWVVIGTFGGFIGLIALGSLSENHGTSPQVVAVKEEAPPPPPEIILKDETDFLSAVVAARSQYQAAQNDFAKGGTRASRKLAVCSLFGIFPKGGQTIRVEDWIGTITTLSSNSDGKGVLYIAPPPSYPHIHFGTWNNSLSDIGDHTLIEPDSPLYKVLTNMKERQKATFSGLLYPSDVDCVKETSVTLSGSMTDPEYLMRFLDIKLR